MDFDKQFKRALHEMIPKETDEYREIQYSDEIFLHVCSHPSGAGSYEIYAIIPHDAVGADMVDRDSGSTLPPEIPGFDEFYDDLEQLISEVTEKEAPDITFYLMEVVDDGAWGRDATMYATHELKA